MKDKLLIDNKSNELIIFLSGWGCDDIQFKNMKASKNVLIFWDYSNLDFNFNFSGYEKYYLIAYSAGVFTAGLIQDKLPDTVCKIAVNGNPLFTDEYFGIPPKTRQIFKELNLDNYMDFRKKYLVINDEELAYFNQNASERSFESCFDELEKLEKLAENNKKIMNFNTAILSDSDRIFNPEHQKEFFNNKYKLLKNSAHNVFYKFQNFDDILKFAIS